MDVSSLLTEKDEQESNELHENDGIQPTSNMNPDQLMQSDGKESNYL